MKAKAKQLELCDTREQRDLAAPALIVGPEIVRVWSGHHPRALHYALAGSPSIALCGVDFCYVDSLGGASRVCAACRVEASRTRAAVR